MRKTSLEAYNTIKEEGLLSELRLMVYEILFEHGPLMAHEVVEYGKQVMPHANQTSFNARLSELEKLGVVESGSWGIHPVSGMKCVLWDVTGQLPKETKPKPKRTFYVAVIEDFFADRLKVFDREEDAKKYAEIEGAVVWKVEGRPIDQA